MSLDLDNLTCDNCKILYEMMTTARDKARIAERKLVAMDEALHENCTLAEDHPTLKIIDELRAEIAVLKARP